MIRDVILSRNGVRPQVLRSNRLNGRANLSQPTRRLDPMASIEQPWVAAVKPGEPWQGPGTTVKYHPPITLLIIRIGAAGGVSGSAAVSQIIPLIDRASL